MSTSIHSIPPFPAQQSSSNPFRRISSFASRAWTWLKHNFSLFPYERTATKVYDLSNKTLLQTYGSAKTHSSPNRSDTDLIARTAMRYPSQKTKEALSKLHGALGSKLLSHSDEALQWLLGGSSKHARFKDVNELRAFLSADPKTLRPSALISGLNTVLSAIAYRYCEKGEEPRVPQTEAQWKLYNAIAETEKYYVPDHQTTYPDSRICAIADHDDMTGYDDQDTFAPSFRDEISVGSYAPDARVSGRVGGALFAKRYENGHLAAQSTWVGAAQASNIPIRLSISGSTLYTLATIEWALGDAPGKLDEKTLELFAGTIIVPTYHRGDYHSVAETGAAFQHYVSTRRGGNPLRAALAPQNALRKGLTLMEGVVDDKQKEPVREAKERVLAATRKTNYKLPDPMTLMDRTRFHG